MSIQTGTYIDVKAADFPINKYFNFSKRVYLFKFKKNPNNFYTVEIYNQNGQTLLYSNKITYGQPIIDSPLSPFQDPIIPLNLEALNGVSGLVDLNDSTFGNQIKLYTGIVET